jgi:hypothetical protein
MIPLFRLALEHVSRRYGQCDRAELRRIHQHQHAGDQITDGLVARGLCSIDREERLCITDAGERAIADPEWMPAQ